LHISHCAKKFKLGHIPGSLVPAVYPPPAEGPVDLIYMKKLRKPRCYWAFWAE